MVKKKATIETTPKTRPQFVVPESKKDATEFDHKSVGIALFIVFLLILGVTLFGKKSVTDMMKKNFPTPAATQITNKLPSDWERVATTQASGVLDKVQKNIKSGIRPTVILMSSTSDITDNKAYVDRLISGDKSDLPSLVFDINQEKNENGYYIRELEGYYYSGDNKIHIKQNIYIKGTHVYTLTASYDDAAQGVSSDVSEVFSYLYQKYL